MNIEAYDTESLRRLVRTLQYENSVLKNDTALPWNADTGLFKNVVRRH